MSGPDTAVHFMHIVPEHVKQHFKNKILKVLYNRHWGEKTCNGAGGKISEQSKYLWGNVSLLSLPQKSNKT